ncbi:hypothetical protein IJG44_10450 [bacterium]|nr:hypothetical protein [bacterium]
MFNVSNKNPIGKAEQIDDKMVKVFDKNGTFKFNLFGILCDGCTEDHVTIINPIKQERNTYDVYGKCIESIKLEEEKEKKDQ